MVDKKKILSLLPVFLFTWVQAGINDILNYFLFEPEESRIVAGMALSFLLMIPALFFGKKIKLYLVLVYLFTIIPSLVFFIHLVLYGSAVTSPSYFVLFETSIREGAEFVSLNFTGWMWFAVLVFIFTPFIIIKYIKPVSFPVKSIPIVVLIFLIPAAVVLTYCRFDGGRLRSIQYTTDFLLSVSDYKKESRLLESYSSKWRNPKEEITATSLVNDSLQPVYIIVIGESTGRHHMGLYGYSRNTTPLLNEIKNELFVFENVFSPHAHTILSLRHALTFSTRADTGSFYTKASLLDLFNRSGFETYWISNQNPLGVTETQVHALASRARYRHFERSSVFSLGNVYDAELLPEIESSLKKKGNKAVFIHLMGTHQDFKYRYPEQFSVFKTANGTRSSLKLTERQVRIINEYDNANLYNDFILRSIIEKVRKTSPYSFVLYFSDHGDEVYEERDFLGHSESNVSKYMLDVPFILWTSPLYRKINEDRIRNFPLYTSRIYCMENMIHGVLDLAKIKTQYLDSCKSVFSDDFKMK